jgi:hypothetical protein
VAVTLGQVKGYCTPFLERKNFRFRQLCSFVGHRRLNDLRLAKAFAHPGEGAANFMKALEGANTKLREPITEELRKLDRGGSVSHEDRMLMIRKIQEIFLESGIHTDFNRPSSVGLVIRSDAVSDTPVYFLLGESGGSATFCGRYYEAVNGIPSRLIVNVTSTASRLVEILDLMFNEGRDDNDRFERALMLRDRESLGAWVSKVDFEPDEVPANMFLFVMSVRESIRKLNELAGECGSPEEFVCRAVNLQLDSVLAHETSHIEEKKANGEIPLSKEAKELIAYLLEASYASPDIAFRAMLDRKFKVEEMMPGLFDDIRGMGGMALLEDSSFLRACALESLDDIFIELSSKSHDEVIRTDIIKAVQKSNYVNGNHMPLVERAMCNPSLR